MPARTVPGGGVMARAANSTTPYCHGTEGRKLPTLNVGRIISRAPSQAMRPAHIADSWAGGRAEGDRRADRGGR
jgi:hypothetical protein